MTYDETLIYVMSTSRGRQFVWEILSRAQIFSTSFSPDPYWHAYLAGKRDQALPIYEEVERLCPELMALARKEADDRSRNFTPSVDNPAGPAAAPVRDTSGRTTGDTTDRSGDYDPYGARQTADGAGNGSQAPGG